MSAPFWGQWLAGTLVPLAALWGLFQLALRGERCFGYNRGLLLLAPLLAAAWQLLPHPALGPAWWHPAAESAGGASVLLPALHIGPAPAVASGAAKASWPGWLLALYAAGVGVGLARLAYRYGQLRRATRYLPREQRPGYLLAYTGGQLPTSSFGRTIFWNERAELTAAEAASVLRHELAHVQQGHSYDVLWLELWRVLLWPNPFVHLLLPALRLTHELLADRAAAGAASATGYRALLARLAARQLSPVRTVSLLQPFLFSFTLTRIAMLKNQIPVRRWKQWLVLPVLGGLFLASSQPADAQAAPADLAARKALSKKKLIEAWRQDSLAGGQSKPGVLTIRRDEAGDFKITHEPGPALAYAPAGQAAPPQQGAPATSAVYTYVEQMPALPGTSGMAAIVQQIQDNIVYPAGMKKEGRVFAKFTVAADGQVRDAVIVKGLAPDYDEAVLAAIRKLPRFIPGKQSGRAVAVSFTVPINFKTKS